MLHFAQIFSYGLINGALYSLVALGLSLVFGVMNYLVVAHGALIMLASYFTYWAFVYLKVDPFLFILIVTPLFFLIGWVLFKVLFQSLMKFSEGEKIKNSLLISFGLLLVFSNLAILLWTADERAVTTGYTGKVFELFEVRLPYIGLGGVSLAIIVIVALHLFLNRTYFGKAIRAVSQDHEAATLMGINVNRVCLVAFSMGFALAGIPGVITSLHAFNPAISFDLTNKALIVLILAGFGSIKGVLLGGLLLGAIEAVGVYFVGTPYREVFGLVLFVLILMFRPQGLAGKKSMKRIILFAVTLACLAAVPLLTRREYVLSLIVLVCLYIILSHSWNLLGGFTGQISLGHSTFFGMGALVFRYLWLKEVPSYLALAAGSFSSLILACLIGFPAFKLKGHYFSIGTLALAMIALITVQNTFPGVSFVPQEYLKTYSLIPIYYMALVAGGVTVILIDVLTRSKLGLGLLSVREDETAAEAIGVNTFKYKVISMSLSTLIAGMGGGLFSFYVASYYYYVPFDLNWSFDPVLITFIGGPGTVAGPVVGSVCFVILKELFAISLGQMNVLIFGVVFILAILFLPEGLIGLVKKIRTRRGGGPDPSDRAEASLNTRSN